MVLSHEIFFFKAQQTAHFEPKSGDFGHYHQNYCLPGKIINLKYHI